jgi:DNA-3-methyladenine glycosylase
VTPGHPLPPAFYARETTHVARALLGQRLVRQVAGHILSGLICETEAYRGADDAASHAFHRTPRSAIMFGPPGHAYVYFIYGMHHCFNVVADDAWGPGAVLIRALVPQEGLAQMRQARSHVPDARLTDGPGKLCQALRIDRTVNGYDLTGGSALWLTSGVTPAEADISATPRIGVTGGHAAQEQRWRFVWQPGPR